MTFLEVLEKNSKKCELAINDYLSNKDIPQSLQETMKYSTLAPGKRLRPALVIETCKLCGGREEDAIPFACAIEMIHTYSLIHDDLPDLDNDDYRRGRLTSHKKFGNAEAILTGDALLSYAFEIMLKNADTPNKVKAATEIAIGAGATKMVAGQWVDVTENGNVLSDSQIEYIHENKTAAMIVAAAKAGAYCADAAPILIQRFEKYAREIGYTFQIVDDILDVEGDSEALGKQVGSDNANNKSTFVTKYGLEGAKKQAKEHTLLALDAVSGFGDEASFFIDLAEYLLTRKK